MKVDLFLYYNLIKFKSAGSRYMAFSDAAKKKKKIKLTNFVEDESVYKFKSATIS